MRASIRRLTLAWLLVALQVSQVAGAAIIGVAFDNGDGVPNNWNSPSRDGTMRNLVDEDGRATSVSITLANYFTACLNGPTDVATVPSHSNSLAKLNTYCQPQSTTSSAVFSGLDPSKKYRVWLIALRNNGGRNNTYEQEWDVIGRTTTQIFHRARYGELAINNDLGSSSRTFASYAISVAPDTLGRISFQLVRAFDLTWQDRIAGKVAGFAIEMATSPINHGLFIGAHDPDPDTVRRFDRNAQTIASAFAARPNTKATVLTGDLSLDANGNRKNPITFAEVANALMKIRTQMKPGDSLTLYINNHGWSVRWLSATDKAPGENGIGDDYIDIGEPIEDNVLATTLGGMFAGFPVTVYLDSCHAGGFWGGTDLAELPPGRGINDLNQLSKITLYASSSEPYLTYGPHDASLSFWGQALLEALQKPVELSGKYLGDFLYKRTREIAFFAFMQTPVWYSLDLGDPVPADMSLIDTFVEHSSDVDMDAPIFSAPEPTDQFDGLLAAVTGVGPGTSLADKIAIARAYFDSDDIVSACEVLGAFTNQVRAQTGNKLTILQSDMLTASAEFTRNSIGCTR